MNYCLSSSIDKQACEVLTHSFKKKRSTYSRPGTVLDDGSMTMNATEEFPSLTEVTF